MGVLNLFRAVQASAPAMLLDPVMVQRRRQWASEERPTIPSSTLSHRVTRALYF